MVRLRCGAFGQEVGAGVYMCSAAPSLLLQPVLGRRRPSWILTFTMPLDCIIVFMSCCRLSLRNTHTHTHLQSSRPFSSLWPAVLYLRLCWSSLCSHCPPDARLFTTPVLQSMLGTDGVQVLAMERGSGRNARSEEGCWPEAAVLTHSPTSRLMNGACAQFDAISEESPLGNLKLYYL